MKDQPILLAVIGGSGLYQFPGLEEAEERVIETPFGSPSDRILTGVCQGRRIAFLPRHGRHHQVAPSRIPHRANIYALKCLGVRWIISLSAVGSLREAYRPRDFVIPTQFFDRTKNSVHHTFFDEGIVAHVSFGNPVCLRLASQLYQAASSAGAMCHWGGTYVNMEGPAFSTRAESEFHRAMGFDVVGMTNLAEAKLAREAEMAYATIAMVTDYDCWHDAENEVSVSDVTAVLRANALLATETVRRAATSLALHEESIAHSALSHAIATPREFWPAEAMERLGPILKPYL